MINHADSRGEIFRIAKQMIGQIKDLIGEQCVKDDVGNVLVDHGEIRNAWRSYNEHLLNEAFPWHSDILEAVEPVQGPPPEIKNEWVKKAIDEMRNGKEAGSTGIVAEMLKASGDIGMNLITKLVNAIIRGTPFPDDWLKSVMVMP